MIVRSAALGDRPSIAIRLHQAITLLDRFPPSILQLMFRIAIAAVFWSSGLTKIARRDTTIALFRDEYMVPLLPPRSPPRGPPRSSSHARLCSSSGWRPGSPPCRSSA
jgi:hypothetical protein